MVDGSGLENRQGASPRGFESHPLRHVGMVVRVISSVRSKIIYASQVVAGGGDPGHLRA